MFNFLSKIRIIPLTIFVAVLTLTVRVTDIWNGVENAILGVKFSGAEAEQALETGAERPRSILDSKSAPKPVEVAALESKVVQNQAAAGKPAIPAPQKSLIVATSAGVVAQGPLAQGFSEDPGFYTQAEVDLLQKLAERRELLEERQKELDVREDMLKAAEGRIDRKIEELQSLQATIESRIKVHDEQREQQMSSLVKIYENMKPKDAARIFEQLAMDTLLEVAERMNERRLAPVLAKMNPTKAKDVTEELARLRSLPQPGQLEGLR